MKKTAQGFTLIELLVVISIIAILSVIGITMYGGVQKSARDAKRKTDLRSIKVALELYKQQTGSYPTADWATDKNSSPWIPGMTFNYFPNGLPKDPLDTGTVPYTSTSGYIYAYWSGNTTTWAGCITNGYPPGQFFVLAAELENKTDSDNLGNKQNKWCDGSVIGWIPTLTSYVVTSL